MNRFQITEYCHELIRQYAPGFACCVDATMGNGNDTQFLSRMAGETGRVFAFDIQEAALENTKKRLEESGCGANTRLILDSHENMGAYVSEEADVIVSNFGYLPGGDHKLATCPETSIPAMEAGLGLLKKGGLMCLCIYSGGDSGHREREAVLTFLKTLDPKKYLVIIHEFFNRPNDPPLPVTIHRL